MRELRLLIIAMLGCLLIALAVVPGLAHADEPDPCATADLLRDLGYTDDAKEKYMDLLESDVELLSCAQEGLKALAPMPTPTPSGEEAVLLSDSLTLVGVRWCPRLFNCGIRYTEGTNLSIPLANKTTELGGLPSIDEPLGLLGNADSGHAVTVWRKPLEMEQGLAIVPLKAPDIEGGGGSYTGSLDLLPNIDEKGDFELNLKLRDFVLWPVLAVLVGVYVSNVARIQVNKYRPAHNLDEQVSKHRDFVAKNENGVTPPLSVQESDWEKALRRWNMLPPPKDEREKWRGTLRRYSIVLESVKRLDGLREDVRKVYRNAQIEVVAADSDQEEVKELYEGLKAEKALVQALHSFAHEALFPAHFTFLAALGQWEQAGLAEKPALLTKAEEMLYVVGSKSAPEAEDVKGAPELSELRSGFEVLMGSLGAMRRALYRWRLANELRLKLAPHASTFGDPDKTRYYRGCGQIIGTWDSLRLETGAKELQDVAHVLDSALVALHSLHERYLAGEEAPTVVAATMPAAPCPAERERAKEIELARPIRLPWLQALYRFRWLPAALALVIAVAVALVTLYFGKTFGSLADYIGALAWGLGVDTASRGVPAVLKALGLSK